MLNEPFKNKKLPNSGGWWNKPIWKSSAWLICLIRQYNVYSRNSNVTLNKILMPEKKYGPNNEKPELLENLIHLDSDR
jgi:hypothetical protein